MVDLNLNINGEARRARAALNDVASGSERAARITDHLSRSFDHLEREANDAQRSLERVQREIADNGPTAELNAQLAQLQHRLSEISDERRVTENLRAQFRRASASAATLDHELANVRRELDRLNDEYSRGGDPAVLRRIQEQQRELERLNGIRRRIADEDENNQARLARLAEEARRAQLRREEEDRRRQDDEDNRTFLRRLRRRTSNLGDNVGNRLNAMPAPPAAIAAGAGAAAVPILAAVGGAVTAALAAGVAGGGVAGAVLGDPERFKTEWSAAAGTLKTEFLDATAIFTGPTLEAIRGIGPLVQSWNLDEVFADAAKYVAPLVGGVEDFASGVVRGVSAMVQKGEPAVEALSSGLAELGDAAGDAFESIADGAEGGGEALRDTIFAVAGLIRVFGELTYAAEEAYSYIHDHPLEAALVSGGLSLPLTLLDQFSDKSDRVAGTIVDLGAASGRAGKETEDAWEGAAAAMQDYEDALHHVYDTQMGLISTEVAWEQAVDDLDAAIKENGKNWDIHTQKGRDNTEQLQQAIDAAIAYRDAQVASGEQTGVANQRLQEQIDYLEGVARKAGLTKEQFDRMTGALQNFMNVDANKTIRITVIKKEIGYVSQEGRIGDGTDPRTWPGKAYASGGTVSETGMALVGEHGPEIRFLRQGDYIMDAQRTARALAGGPSTGLRSSDGPLTIRFAGDTNSWMAQGFMAAVGSGQIQIFDSTGEPVTARP